MGFFSKLFGNILDTNNNQSKPTAEISVKPREEQLIQPILSVHPDIRNLIWIGDGRFKNYLPAPSQKNTVYVGDVVISVSFSGAEEPSLILSSLPIANANGVIERPPYYPTYKDLTPEQKGVYWKLLANPYDNTIDIGYVFILYYGLERYLLTDKYENAIDVIIKLRDVHSNKSFQTYTANAIILTCLAQKRADIIQRFMDSLDKNYEFDFSPNLYLLCKYSLRLPLTASDLMRLSKAFEFTKTTYLKKYPDVFFKQLSSNVISKFKDDVISWEKLISNTDFKALPSEDATIFANVSIMDKTIRVPSLLSSFKLKKNIYDLLDKTHEDIKQQLAELRKEGVTIPENPANAKTEPKKELVFDNRQERELRDGYEKAKNNPVERHFALIYLQDFYYKYRNLNRLYLEDCIAYCNEDISCLPELQASYKEQEKARYLSYSFYLSPSEIQQKISEIGPFLGSIPAFQRLAIIYEKEKDYDKAIEISDQAIAYYSSIGFEPQVSEFVERRKKLIKRKDVSASK